MEAFKPVFKLIHFERDGKTTIDFPEASRTAFIKIARQLDIYACEEMVDITTIGDILPEDWEKLPGKLCHMDTDRITLDTEDFYRRRRRMDLSLNELKS